MNTLRPLPIALAHVTVATPLNSPRRKVLDRLYFHMSPADKLRCRHEVLECYAAKRGERLATIE